MENLFALEKEITSVEIDFKLDTKLSYLFLFFQEIASRHSDILGCGRSATTEKGLHWVITRFSVDIIKAPRYGDKVIVKTYPGDNNVSFFYRYFLIEDLKGNVLVKASSVWLVLDAKTGMIKKKPFGELEVPMCHLEDELPLPNKVDVVDGELLYKKIVRYSDVDLNNHLNNTRYIELIQDAFDEDYLKDHQIKSITINYVAEIKEKDEVEIYKSTSNPYVIIGKVNSKVHFVAELLFK